MSHNPYRDLERHRQSVARWTEILLELQCLIRTSPASQRRSRARAEYHRRSRTRKGTRR